MVAPQEDANCHEDMVLEIQNIITDLNQFAHENTLQIETKEIESSTQEGRPVFFFILTFLYSYICIYI